MNFEPWLKALSWMLIHSLWQGLTLFVVAGLIILMTRRSGPFLRYNLLVITLVCFVAVCGFTLKSEWVSVQKTNNEYLPAGHAEEARGILNGFDYLRNILEHYGRFDSVIDLLNVHSGWIVSLWFVVFCLKCLSILRDLGRLSHLKVSCTSEATEEWLQRMEKLKKRLKIKQKVKLLESDRVDIPGVSGFLKPVIFVPLGMLSHLPADQVEAILLHELAHIRRQDFMVNLLQSFAEAVFFFNPGLLWLSSVIREERENCCDDLAIQITRDKGKFVRALVAFQEFRMETNRLSPAFAQNRPALLGRVKRILNSDNKSLSRNEKTFLSLGLVLVMILLLTFSRGKIITKPAGKLLSEFREATAEMIKIPQGVHSTPVEATENYDSDLTPAGKESYLKKETTVAEPAYFNGEGIVRGKHSTHYFKDSIAIEMKGEKIVQLVINGRPVPEAEVSRHLSEISSTLTDLRNEYKEEGGVLSPLQVMKTALHPLSGEAGKLSKYRSEYAPYVSTRQDYKSVLPETPRTPVKGRPSPEIGSPAVNDPEKDRKDSGRALKKTGFASESIPRGMDVEKLNADVIEDLYRENIIIDLTDLSYKLDASELIVNGKKQKELLHQKLKEKYIKTAKSTVYYNYAVSDT